MVTRKIFISSAVTDCAYERDYLLKNLHNLDTPYVRFVPQLSEHPETFNFSAHNLRNSLSEDVCLDNVKKCNYYVLLIKNDYKCSDKYGCSITELEYRKAKEKNKEIFVFILKNAENETEDTKAFKERVSGERWRFEIERIEEAIGILKDIILKFNRSDLLDETIPDGSVLKRGTTFQKKWVLENAGNVVWEGYRLKLETPNDTLMPNITSIDMPMVVPGETYELEITHTCKFTGRGKCVWKMYDKNDNIVFPNYLGIWADVIIKREL